MIDNGLWMGLATIFAVFLGPLIAVYATRYMDNRRADKARKVEIFRTLMRTRGIPTRLHWDHVGALNLVEVEFIKYPAVIQAWKCYLSILRKELPPLEQKDHFDAFIREREELLTKLIDEIAKTIKIEVPQLEILRGNYVPQAWDDNEWEKQLVRRGLVNVLHGKTPIQFQPYQSQQGQSPHPSPPNSR